MKKCNFYGMSRSTCGPVAIMHRGYTDGKWYYYRWNHIWHAIHPTTGLSVCAAHSRKEAAERAHTITFPYLHFDRATLDRWSREFDRAVSQAMALSLPAGATV